MMNLFSQIPLTVVILWTIITISIYFFILNNDQHKTIHLVNTEKLFDSVVFITMGRMAESNMIDISLASVRKIGRWKGDLFILTDRPGCFVDSVKQYNVKIITVPSMPTLIDIKAMKANVFKYLPSQTSSVIYLDSDILVTRNLNTFIKDIHKVLLENHRKSTYMSTPSNDTFPFDFDLGLFRDAKGHFVGFCSGCDKWHTGVLWLRRGKGEHCLQSWETVLRSGRYDTDQQSLDQSESDGTCGSLVSLPLRHLLFAKDYIALFFTSGRTFLHLTALGRLDTQDYFYREVVAPRLISGVLAELEAAGVGFAGDAGSRKRCVASLDSDPTEGQRVVNH